MLDRSGERFTDADISGYMNPFIEQALAPAARNTREYFGKQAQADNAMAASRGAFGGSRHAMVDVNRMNAEGRAVGDLYSQGYASAFDRASDLWSGDVNRARGLAGDYAGLGEAYSRMTDADLSRLYGAGGLERGLDQAGLDFDYNQFLEGRDWNLRGLNALTGTMGSVPTPSTTINKTTSKGSPLGALASLGMMATGIGALGGLAGLGAGAAGTTALASAAPAVGLSTPFTTAAMFGGGGG